MLIEIHNKTNHVCRDHEVYGARSCSPHSQPGGSAARQQERPSNERRNTLPECIQGHLHCGSTALLERKKKERKEEVKKEGMKEEKKEGRMNKMKNRKKEKRREGRKK